MILIFGGTTEGRKAVEVLEEAGTMFYYSTKTGEQELILQHGIRIDGALDRDGMVAFCREHDIRLLVDAAHPFAAQLHETVASVASTLQLPAIRYERIFPERDESVEWVDRVEDINWGNKPMRVLSTLGVQSIAHLKPYEKPDRRFIYRILPRESSVWLAHAQGATDEQLCYYHEGEDEIAELRRLHPDVILLKESGLSGGFIEKTEAAKALGIRRISLRRPATPAVFHLVNGPYGLRRMVEKLLPDFYPLKSGLTTGTCATAASVAALRRWLTGQESMEIAVRLPNGETIIVPVSYMGGTVCCYKDAGDDPDVTNGIRIECRLGVALPQSDCVVCVTQGCCQVRVYAGIGIGRFTLPGFDYPPGEPAVNKGPRRMLEDNLQQMLRNSAACLKTREVHLLLSIPEGAAIARRTFNPRLGIEGGISVIGVSGIVQPYSEEAFLESIHKCLKVAKASGARRVVIGSGAKSEDVLRKRYPTLPSQAFVQYGNYVGDTLRMASDLDFEDITLGMMLGKAVKLAAGQMDTHSRRATFDRSFVGQLLAEAHCDARLAERVALVRELWELIPQEQIASFVATVLEHCRKHCQPLFPKGHLTLLLVDDEGGVWE